MAPCIEVVPVWWHGYLQVGVSITILAVLGVFVPLFREWNKIGRWEKAGWTALMFALAGLEILALHVDREEHDDQQAFERCEQLDHFQKIADGIQKEIDGNELAMKASHQQFKETMEKSNAQFKKTMAKAGDILERSEQAATLSKRNLDSIMGTDSVPCITPQPWALPGGKVQLILRNLGGNNLTGVEVNLYTNREYANSVSRSGIPAIALGTLTPHWSKELPAIVPEIDGQVQEGVGRYYAAISTQNGHYMETIDIKPSADPRYAWATRYWMVRDLHSNKEEKIGNTVIPKGATSGSGVPECMAGGWSDEAKP